MGDLSGIAGTVRGLFPWLAQVTYEAGTRALSISSAVRLLRLVGGGPAVARVGDLAGYLYVVVTAGAVSAVYWSAKSGAGSAWHLVASGAAPPVDGVTTGTPIVISTGSAKVTCG